MLRPATVDDLPFLDRMLRTAAGASGPILGEAEAAANPELQRYLAGWGRAGDVGLVAVADEGSGEPLGAAWYRTFPADAPGYGWVDDRTPELAVGLVPGAQGGGVGRQLVDGLLERAHAAGVEALSLSVRADNTQAKVVYDDAGFVVVGQDAAGEHLTMVCPTDPAARRRPPTVEAVAPGALDPEVFAGGPWGSFVISRGRRWDLAELPAFVAHVDGSAEVAGLVHWRLDDGLEGPEAELVSIDARVPDRGVGTALLRAVRRAAADAGCRRVWLVTGNDNLSALRFYQRRGWDLVAVHRGAGDEARALKPSIPEIGHHGIRVRHEVELEWRF